MPAMRVRFVRPYIYTPSASRRVATKYKPSENPQIVNDECGERAIAGGFAELVEDPARPLAAAAPKKKRSTGRSKRAGRSKAAPK